MSRTYKDKPWKFKNPEAYDYTFGCEKVTYERETKNWRTGEPIVVQSYFYRELPGVKAKKKKRLDTEWHWMTTPSWWTRMTMNRPQRREAHLWEHEVVRTSLEDLEELDKPNVSHKPHNYYW